MFYVCLKFPGDYPVDCSDFNKDVKSLSLSLDKDVRDVRFWVKERLSGTLLSFDNFEFIRSFREYNRVHLDGLRIMPSWEDEDKCKNMNHMLGMVLLGCPVELVLYYEFADIEHVANIEDGKKYREKTYNKIITGKKKVPIFKFSGNIQEFNVHGAGNDISSCSVKIMDELFANAARMERRIDHYQNEDGVYLNSTLATTVSSSLRDCHVGDAQDVYLKQPDLFAKPSTSSSVFITENAMRVANDISMDYGFSIFESQRKRNSSDEIAGEKNVVYKRGDVAKPCVEVVRIGSHDKCEEFVINSAEDARNGKMTLILEEIAQVARNEQPVYDGSMSLNPVQYYADYSAILKNSGNVDDEKKKMLGKSRHILDQDQESNPDDFGENAQPGMADPFEYNEDSKDAKLKVMGRKDYKIFERSEFEVGFSSIPIVTVTDTEEDTTVERSDQEDYWIDEEYEEEEKVPKEHPDPKSEGEKISKIKGVRLHTPGDVIEMTKTNFGCSICDKRFDKTCLVFNATNSTGRPVIVDKGPIFPIDISKYPAVKEKSHPLNDIISFANDFSKFVAKGIDRFSKYKKVAESAILEMTVEEYVKDTPCFFINDIESENGNATGEKFLTPDFAEALFSCVHYATLDNENKDCCKDGCIYLSEKAAKRKKVVYTKNIGYLTGSSYYNIEGGHFAPVFCNNTFSKCAVNVSDCYYNKGTYQKGTGTGRSQGMHIIYQMKNRDELSLYAYLAYQGKAAAISESKLVKGKDGNFFRTPCLTQFATKSKLSDFTENYNPDTLAFYGHIEKDAKFNPKGGRDKWSQENKMRLLVGKNGAPNLNDLRLSDYTWTWSPSEGEYLAISQKQFKDMQSLNVDKSKLYYEHAGSLADVNKALSYPPNSAAVSILINKSRRFFVHLKGIQSDWEKLKKGKKHFGKKRIILAIYKSGRLGKLCWGFCGLAKSDADNSLKEMQKSCGVTKFDRYYIFDKEESLYKSEPKLATDPDSQKGQAMKIFEASSDGSGFPTFKERYDKYIEDRKKGEEEAKKELTPVFVYARPDTFALVNPESGEVVNFETECVLSRDGNGNIKSDYHPEQKYNYEAYRSNVLEWLEDTSLSIDSSHDEKAKQNDYGNIGKGITFTQFYKFQYKLDTHLQKTAKEVQGKYSKDIYLDYTENCVELDSPDCMYGIKNGINYAEGMPKANFLKYLRKSKVYGPGIKAFEKNNEGVDVLKYFERCAPSQDTKNLRFFKDIRRIPYEVRFEHKGAVIDKHRSYYPDVEKTPTVFRGNLDNPFKFRDAKYENNNYTWSGSNGSEEVDDILYLHEKIVPGAFEMSTRSKIMGKDLNIEIHLPDKGVVKRESVETEYEIKKVKRTKKVKKTQTVYGVETFGDVDMQDNVNVDVNGFFNKYPLDFVKFKYNDSSEAQRELQNNKEYILKSICTTICNTPEGKDANAKRIGEMMFGTEDFNDINISNEMRKLSVQIDKKTTSVYSDFSELHTTMQVVPAFSNDKNQFISHGKNMDDGSYYTKSG